MRADGKLHKPGITTGAGGIGELGGDHCVVHPLPRLLRVDQPGVRKRHQIRGGRMRILVR